ncbi:ABC transporter substrate-binding protein [Azospirillum halopraeferens]|uniref:ABC transporter substrate-binding protein n=1 Tax=Azospirillum halopraeferens TaxID=34010 RepID=UPI00041C7216|nr:ABC transporter substrate-binding protein [Azospirillum halopraeferens]
MGFPKHLAAAALLSLAAGAAAAAPSGTLTVYTSQPTDQMAAVVKAFTAAHPDVTVELFRSGTTEVMNKLQAEFTAGDPRADVVLIADAVATTQLKNDGRLLAYPDAPTGAVPAALIDPDRTFFGTKLITTGIVYNTGLVTTPPVSWNDLKTADAARATIMPSPLYSGAAAIHVGTMVQQPAFGWSYYEELAKGGAVAGKGNGSVIEAVARGEKAYGIIIEYMALNARAKGSPVGFVVPQEGVSVITQPVAILKTAKNVEAAKAFVAWQLSEAAQRQAVEQGYYPVIPGMAAPEGYPDLKSVRILEADPAVMLKSDEEMKKTFADLFGG